jgi:hypothetical protein
MTPHRISIVAIVECRSESRGEERPIAVWFADQRLEIADVIDHAMVTSIEAGEPVRHRLWVELEDGNRCELTRTKPDGAWRVRVER